MIYQRGVIVSTSGDTVTVRVGRVAACEACDAGKGCGAGIFGRLLRTRPIAISVRNDISARAGQLVELGITDSRFLQLVLYLYGLPVLAGIAGAGLGLWFSHFLGVGDVPRDLLSLTCGLALAAIALRMSSRLGREFPGLENVHLREIRSEMIENSCAQRGNVA